MSDEKFVPNPEAPLDEERARFDAFFDRAVDAAIEREAERCFSEDRRAAYPLFRSRLQVWLLVVFVLIWAVVMGLLFSEDVNGDDLRDTEGPAACAYDYRLQYFQFEEWRIKAIYCPGMRERALEEIESRWPDAVLMGDPYRIHRGQVASST